jgi:hypothetical protein
MPPPWKILPWKILELLGMQQSQPHGAGRGFHRYRKELPKIAP